jgi:hypothetical protein
MRSPHLCRKSYTPRDAIGSDANPAIGGLSPEFGLRLLTAAALWPAVYLAQRESRRFATGEVACERLTVAAQVEVHAAFDLGTPESRSASE